MTETRLIVTVSMLVILGSGIDSQDKSVSTTTLYLTEKDLDPEARRLLVENYIDEYFSDYM